MSNNCDETTLLRNEPLDGDGEDSAFHRRDRAIGHTACEGSVLPEQPELQFHRLEPTLSDQASTQGAGGGAVDGPIDRGGNELASSSVTAIRNSASFSLGLVDAYFRQMGDAAHPDRCHSLFGHDDPQLRFIQADVHDEWSVADALACAYAVVNAVSLYVEHGHETFHSVHVESAERVAAQAFRAGAKRFAHVSGIGADPSSSSLYIRKRGEGELAVRAAFADALLIRPAVMFGPDDAFLTTILKLLDQLPIFPMFGRGRTRLHPCASAARTVGAIEGAAVGSMMTVLVEVEVRPA